MAVRRGRRAPNSIAATDLAKLGACETQAMLIAKHGDRTSPEREVQRRAGDHEHARFHVESSQQHNAGRGGIRNARCFIASVVLGPNDPDTRRLRRFRDTRLRRTRIGRAGIAAYCRFSPPIAQWLNTHPMTARGVATALRAITRFCLAKEGT